MRVIKTLVRLIYFVIRETFTERLLTPSHMQELCEKVLNSFTGSVKRFDQSKS